MQFYIYVEFGITGGCVGGGKTRNYVKNFKYYDKLHTLKNTNKHKEKKDQTISTHVIIQSGCMYELLMLLL